MMPEEIVHASGVYRPQDLHEGKYTTQLKSLAREMFPQYYWCDFRSYICSPLGGVCPDAALVARDYSRWVIVEVEIHTHSWPDHIKPQLERLLNCILEEKHRDYLLKNNPHLAVDGMDRLDLYDPALALLIDRATHIIRNWCRQREITCLEAAPYRSVHNQYALALIGDRPEYHCEPQYGTAVEMLHYVQDDSLVPVFSYKTAGAVAKLDCALSVRVGSTIVDGKNFSSAYRGLVLRMDRKEFEKQLGCSVEYVLHSTSDGNYSINSTERETHGTDENSL